MKKILIISPPFFGYYDDVANEMRRQGAEVDWIDDRPSTTILFKSLSKISYRTVQLEINQYFREVINTVSSKQYDAIFVLGGMSWCFDAEQTKDLKEASKSQLVFYLWDTIGNCQRVREVIKEFDAVLSFDPDDCTKYGLVFLPLFYSFNPPAFRQKMQYEYDACFIGSVHQVSKFKKIKELVDRVALAGGRVFTHYYIPSRSAALLRQLQFREYRGVNLTTRALSRSETLNIYSSSRTLIDSPQGGQRGLTIRSIESVGMNRRLLTANSSVKQYDIYSTGNVIVDDGTSDISQVFADPVCYPEEMRCQYSIKCWVSKVFELMGEL